MVNAFYTNHNSIPDRSDSGEIIVPMSSIGSNRILHRLATESVSPNPFCYDVYLINVLTMLRNNSSADDPLIATENDINTIKTYLTEYIASTPRHISPVIVFYLPDYKIPEEYARKPNAETTKLRELNDKMRKHTPGDVVLLQTNDTYSVYFFKCLRAVHPGRQIYQYIPKMCNKGMGAKVLLWSHITLDLHIASLFNHVDLIESYTAKIIPSCDFGLKLTKNTINIPFNSITHIAFGDKQFIKPALQRANRKRALHEIQWKLINTTKLISKLGTYGISKEYLTKMKL